MNYMVRMKKGSNGEIKNDDKLTKIGINGVKRKCMNFTYDNPLTKNFSVM